MAIEDKTRVIRIESILGGEAPSEYFARPDQFQAALGIDPSKPANNSTRRVAGGVIRPVATEDISNNTMAGIPRWIKAEPKNGLFYVYDFSGSVYTIPANLSAPSGIGDLTDGGTSTGNGMEYYDNYIYFARDTTIARYGPLNGTAAFTDDYWVSTLSKTALTNTQYPDDSFLGVSYPNHVMHRHSDGKLYFADVVGNQGVLHVISTTKATVEGDTDNGSTYQKLTFGYGLWPTAIESYGSDLVIALFEGRGNYNGGNISPAKIAFWDTTSQNFNKIIWSEFPDSLITGLKNVNGTLYILSGAPESTGYRISRFIGGYTIEELFYNETGEPPYPGAIDANGGSLFFGSYIDWPDNSGCVFSYGLPRESLNNGGLFNVMGCSDTTTAARVTCLTMGLANQAGLYNPITGWTIGSSGVTNNGIDVQNVTYRAKSQWWSQKYKIGKKFKIKKVRIPLAYQTSSNTNSVIAYIHVDQGLTAGATTLGTIDNTTYPNKSVVVFRPTNLVGEQDFALSFSWAASTSAFPLTIALPITIEYETIDD